MVLVVSGHQVINSMLVGGNANSVTCGLRLILVEVV